MKIAILTHDENTSAGWGRFSDQLISGLRARGHEVMVITEVGGSYPLLRRGVRLVLSAMKIAPLLARCDVVHGLDVYPFGIAAWLANFYSRKPLIFSVHGTYSIAPLIESRYRFIARIACRGAQKIVALSRFTASRVSAALGEKVSMTIIEGGVDLTKWNLAETYPRTRALISVGALKPRKGYEYTLRAFAMARERIPDLTWWIIGSPDDRGYAEKLRDQAHRLGVDSAITWYEDITDIELKQLYLHSSLFVLLSQNKGSHFEGFGLVFLEAAACGLPVIGTRGNGIEDAIGAENGILVPQGNSEVAANAILAYLSDEQKWLQASQASKKWAESHAITGVIDQYEKEYSALLS